MTSPLPVAWLCEFMREDDTTDRQVLLEDPECTRWADCADGDGVSPYRVTPLYAAHPGAQEAKDAARLDWLDQNIFHREMDEWDRKRCPGKTMWVLFAPDNIQGSARWIIDAAIADQAAQPAQAVKPATEQEPK